MSTDAPEFPLRADVDRMPYSVLLPMLFPTDERKRKELLALVYASSLEKAAPELEPVSSDIWTILLHAPPLAVVEGGDCFEDVILKAWYAGTILKYMAVMQHAGEAASVRKAVYLVSKHLFGVRPRDGNRVPSTERTIRKGWNEFKPVAHLWAAVWSLGNEDDPEGQLKALTEVSLRDFLALAEWFREFGEQHNPSHQVHYGSTLDPSTTWRPPSDYPLPKLEISLEMPPWMKAALSK